MESFMLYIVKSSLCLVLFYLFYKTLLSKETFFRFNRLVLLAGIITCSILPLIKFQTEKELLIQTPVRQMEKLILADNTTSYLSVEADVDDAGDNISAPQAIDYPKYTKNEPSRFSLSQTQIIGLIYLAGLILTLTGLCISIYRMIQLIRKGEKIRTQDHTLILTKQKICPFSFGKYIVLSEADFKQNSKEIIIHEQVHAKKRHSLDLLFAEFFILLHWFNPVIWLLKRELQDVHEYEADNGVINLGIDATQYQLLLVKKAVGARSYAIANSFNHSKIKNRITMMLKRKSTQWARLKLLLFVPLAAAALQAFARPAIAHNQESLNNSEVTNFAQENKTESLDFSYIGNDTVPTKQKKSAPTPPKSPNTTSEPKAPKPPKFKYSEEVPMTEKEKAATKEFEAAAEKFSAVMSKQAQNIQIQTNSKEMETLSKEFEAAGKKFTTAMEKWQVGMEKTSESKEMQTQSQEFEAAAQKFAKVMEKHKDEIKEGIESPEVLTAKKEFDVAREQFRKNMKQLKENMKDFKESPELKASQEDFKAASQKYKDGMSKALGNMKYMTNDPEVKAAKEDFNTAKAKFREEMKGYEERVKAKRQAES